MQKVNEQISLFISSSIGAYSLIDFKTTLDIVLLCLSILNILVILISKVINYLKDGKIDEQEKEDLKNDVNNLVDAGKEVYAKIKEGEENGRHEDRK